MIIWPLDVGGLVERTARGKEEPFAFHLGLLAVRDFPAALATARFTGVPPTYQ